MTTTPTLRQRAEAVANAIAKTTTEHRRRHSNGEFHRSLAYSVVKAIETVTDEVLGELDEWAENLRHSEDAKLNWDHAGNDKREPFYKNMVAHSWIQAGQAMKREVARLRASLREPLP